MRKRRRKQWHARDGDGENELRGEDKISSKGELDGWPVPGSGGDGCIVASMLAGVLRRSNSLHGVAHRMSASRWSGRERPSRNRI